VTAERARAFLGEPTPHAWVSEALGQLPALLQDHANCELKAASTALAFIYRYPERTALAQRMSRLAREELRHFEQTRRLMTELQLPFRRLPASRYAASMREAVRPVEPERLLDMLLVAALIEARSCERFAALVPRLPERIARFYGGLLASEARHFEVYLELARRECGVEPAAVDERANALRAVEAELVTSPDSQFRFHSGMPVTAGA
jgi:tRNA-(ms[2]io[6]A)-hydroxylase